MRSSGSPRATPPPGRFHRAGRTTHVPYDVPGTEPDFARPTYTSTGARRRTRLVARAARFTGRVAHHGVRGAARRVISASEADGAKESGLTALIWNQVLSYGTDAMVTVALAGTVFFGASAHAQRGNVLLYLLVTMAPFAVVAPFIGPALDRLQHGRRWTMAATAFGRAALALLMATHPTDLLVLYPCALGSLVLSKAYGVVRAAAAPRLVPRGLTLNEANARLTMFGLASTIVLGGLVGAVIRFSGSYSAGLVVTALGFAACGVFAVRLPRQVDSAAVARARRSGRAAGRPRVTLPRRVAAWARRGYAPPLIVALQGEAVLRLLSGLLTIYLAFYVETTRHGFAGVAELAAVVGAAGVGNFLGTAIGTRLRPAKPVYVVVGATCLAAAVCVAGAAVFGIVVAVAAVLVCAVSNALAKISLDSLIQNDVPEIVRSSAFARSETFLQLAWVVGAAIGVVVPAGSPDDGTLAFAIAAAITVGTALVVLLRTRAINRHPVTGETVAGDTVAGETVAGDTVPLGPLART